MKNIRIGQLINVNGFIFMRCNKKTAKRCYNLGMAFEVIPHHIEQTSQHESFTTVSRSMSFNATFEEEMQRIGFAWGLNKSQYMDYYIPVKAVNRFTGKPYNITFGSDPKEYNLVYASDVYETLSV